ncbi:hypothetical protein DFJ73DRAFT_964900 [Zopfochytrium polystomum]|nr:hypothetical protein DFJ73DRAFT_964900 [Zopfochytrium polystomum]
MTAHTFTMCNLMDIIRRVVSSSSSSCGNNSSGVAPPPADHSRSKASSSYGGSSGRRSRSRSRSRSKRSRGRSRSRNRSRSTSTSSPAASPAPVATPLSPEILIHIFLFLAPSFKDIVAASATCRSWNRIAEYELVWRSVCALYEVDLRRDETLSAPPLVRPAPPSSSGMIVDSIPSSSNREEYEHPKELFKSHVALYGLHAVRDYAVIRRTSRRLATVLPETNWLALSIPGPWRTSNAHNPHSSAPTSSSTLILPSGPVGAPSSLLSDVSDAAESEEGWADGIDDDDHAPTWYPDAATASHAELQLALFFHLFSNGQDGSWRYSTRITGLGLFGTFNCYHQLYSAYLLPRSKVRKARLRSQLYSREGRIPWIWQVIKFADSIMAESYGVVTEGSEELLGHVVRYGTVSGTHRMAIPRGRVPFFDLGPFETFLERFVTDIEQGNRRIIRSCGVPSAFVEVGPGTSIAVTNGVEIVVSSFFLLASAKLCYRISITFKPELCSWPSVQLARRRWLFRKQNGGGSRIEGDASDPHFAYSSYSEGGMVEAETSKDAYDDDELTLDNPIVSMEGALIFVPGSLKHPLGPEFAATVARVNFELPQISW